MDNDDDLTIRLPDLRERFELALSDEPLEPLGPAYAEFESMSQERAKQDGDASVG